MVPFLDLSIVIKDCVLFSEQSIFFESSRIQHPAARFEELS